MHTRTEGDKITITLTFSFLYDETSGGYIVIEKDGPDDREVRWGPMPHYLTDEFVRQRSKQVFSTFEAMANNMFASGAWK